MATARFAALFWGRLLAKVLHDADCAVLTGTHIEEEAAAPEVLAFRNILCAVDRGRQSCAAVKWAGELAANSNRACTSRMRCLPLAGAGRVISTPNFRLLSNVQPGRKSTVLWKPLASALTF
jgi:hypothetical protein